MEPNRGQPAEVLSLRPKQAPRPQEFDSTHWSMVLLAQDGNAPQGQAALAALCQIYWYPIYAFIHRRSVSADEAEDLTQAFFTRFLEKGFIGEAEQSKGKFRAFLLACCKHFLANQRKEARTLKRGGGQIIVSLDVEAARQRYVREPADTLDAEKLFDRGWALTLLERSLDQLGQEYGRQQRTAIFEELKSHLVGDPSSSYGEVARRLGMTEAAVKKAAQRLRERGRAIVREQILATVQGPEQVEDEIRELFAVLSS